jgi:uncharacterized protein
VTPPPEQDAVGGNQWPGRPEQLARLVVNVAELRRRLGQRRVEPIDVVLAPQVVVGSRTVERPVHGALTIESIERGVSAYGTVRFEWQGDCRRCLEPVDGEIEVEIAEIFQVDAPDDSDLIDFDGDQIDLVPVVRDAVALSLPLAPLCRDDCAGPDPDRYPTITADQLSGSRAGPDPRWAALDQLDLE